MGNRAHAEQLHASAQNAMAERINGILKQEFGLGGGFKSKALGRVALKQSVHIYNTRRPHRAFDGQTPDAIYFAGLPTVKAAA